MTDLQVQGLASLCVIAGCALFYVVMVYGPRWLHTLITAVLAAVAIGLPVALLLGWVPMWP